jgi:putative FmdB family regulatory protein
MPIHIYHCTKDTCTAEDHERLVKFSNAEEQTCNVCGEKLEIIPSFGNFALKGHWFKTMKSH